MKHFIILYLMKIIKYQLFILLQIIFLLVNFFLNASKTILVVNILYLTDPSLYVLVLLNICIS